MVWIVTLIVVALQVLQAPASQPAVPAALRFHHLHYRVADPIGAMHRVAGPGGEGPTILQGIGVGVAVGAQYMLFDRTNGGVPPPPVSLMTAYPALVTWFAKRGLSISADAREVAELSRLLPGEALDHLAFATANLPDASARLARAGVRVTTRNDASVMIDGLIAGVRVEIVRDPDLPDAFWCPMHPDVRSAVEGACPICRMALVPIPAPRIGEYRLDVTLLPSARGAGAPGLRLAISDPEGKPAASFISVHDKRLHLFVVSRNLEYFRHLHPDQLPDGTFQVRTDIPAGEYMVIADFLPAGGTPQMAQRAIATPGTGPGPFVEPAESNPVFASAAGGLKAAMAVPDLVAGRSGVLHFTLSDARSGAAVTNLEPYLSAPAHALLVSGDLTFAVHGHPREQDAFGPALSFEFLAPAPGLYKMWLQVQRSGRVITLPFVLRVN